MDTSILKGNKKEIYDYLWKDSVFDFDVVKTGESDPSYEFEFGGKDLTTIVGESLANNFAISEPDKKTFIEKFKMACSGNGEELRKITTMHSSSLCALLFFFRNKKLHMIDCVFEESYFEFKNKVIGYPSNVDIVLLGKNKEGKKVILFLESKFSEYITGITKTKNKYEIGKSYFKEGCYSEPIYNELFKNKMLIKQDDTHISAEKDMYIEGIKQIISHYYGIRNFMNKKYYEKDNDNLEKLKDHGAEEFILGEIVFDNFSDTLKNKYLVHYENDYSTLAGIINKQCDKECPNLRVLEKTLHYSDLQEFISDLPEVHKFYFGK